MHIERFDKGGKHECGLAPIEATGNRVVLIGPAANIHLTRADVLEMLRWMDEARTAEEMERRAEQERLDEETVEFTPVHMRGGDWVMADDLPDAM